MGVQIRIGSYFFMPVFNIAYYSYVSCCLLERPKYKTKAITILELAKKKKKQQ